MTNEQTKHTGILQTKRTRRERRYRKANACVASAPRNLLPWSAFPCLEHGGAGDFALTDDEAGLVVMEVQRVELLVPVPRQHQLGPAETSVGGFQHNAKTSNVRGASRDCLHHSQGDIA
eukprot:1182118-Prorocentrum_minimum.AAC.1